MSEREQVYAERLRAPLAWWLIAGAFLLSFWLAMGFYLGWLPGLLATAVLGGLAAWVLIGYGAVTVGVDADGFTAGDARIAWGWVGGIQALDADQARRRQGPEADARAHLLLRPYLKQAIELTVNDPADPHPYWLVSCRDPDAIVAAAGARSADWSTTGEPG